MKKRGRASLDDVHGRVVEEVPAQLELFQVDAVDETARDGREEIVIGDDLCEVNEELTRLQPLLSSPSLTENGLRGRWTCLSEARQPSSSGSATRLLLPTLPFVSETSSWQTTSQQMQ